MHENHLATVFPANVEKKTQSSHMKISDLRLVVLVAVLNRTLLCWVNVSLRDAERCFSICGSTTDPVFPKSHFEGRVCDLVS